MAKGKAIASIWKAAAKAGPIVILVARQLTPQIQKILKENPDAFAGLLQRFSRVRQAKNTESAPKGLENRATILREQVVFLYASANTSDLAKQAIAWRNELDAIERALPVIKAMKRGAQISQRRKFSHRLDELSQQILAASLADEVEDAVIVDDQPTDPEIP
ncbi:MAG: hypothetical protein ACTHW1_03620 [Ancrocorticia sp.]|uniref:hypothetical protein n=1 Tax=Ancrocorticia sp. TaxID=2593684 RepID=UPI003F8F8BA5